MHPLHSAVGVFLNGDGRIGAQHIAHQLDMADGGLVEAVVIGARLIFQCRALVFIQPGIGAEWRWCAKALAVECPAVQCFGPLACAHLGVGVFQHLDQGIDLERHVFRQRGILVDHKRLAGQHAAHGLDHLPHAVQIVARIVFENRLPRPLGRVHIAHERIIRQMPHTTVAQKGHAPVAEGGARRKFFPPLPARPPFDFCGTAIRKHPGDRIIRLVHAPRRRAGKIGVCPGIGQHMHAHTNQVRQVGLILVVEQVVDHIGHQRAVGQAQHAEFFGALVVVTPATRLGRAFVAKRCVGAVVARQKVKTRPYPAQVAQIGIAPAGAGAAVPFPQIDGVADQFIGGLHGGVRLEVPDPETGVLVL